MVVQRRDGCRRLLDSHDSDDDDDDDDIAWLQHIANWVIVSGQ